MIGTQAISYLILPRAIFDCARSWLGYMNGRAPEKEWMWANAWGWKSPEMAEHWDRYWANRNDWEARKNLITEWVRLSPERAGKVFSLLVVTLFAGGLVGWLTTLGAIWMATS